MNAAVNKSEQQHITKGGNEKQVRDRDFTKQKDFPEIDLNFNQLATLLKYTIMTFLSGSTVRIRNICHTVLTAQLLYILNTF